MSTTYSDALILDRSRYAAMRDSERARVIPLRELRRVALDDVVSITFESDETLRYQAQEMVYVEGITDIALAAEELDLYGRLRPSRTQLHATLMVELTDPATVRQELATLTGLQHQIQLRLGDTVLGATELPGPDESGPSEQTASVHFLTIQVNEEHRRLLADLDVPASLESALPAHPASTGLSPELRAALVADLEQAEA